MTWLGSELIFNILMRSGTSDKKKLDKGTFWFIWIMLTVAITAAINLTNFTSLSIAGSRTVPYCGLGMIVAGMIFRLIAILTLGRFFTTNLTIRESHTLKKEGIYKFIRHPSYTGSLVSFAGFGLSLNNWLSLSVIVLLVTIAFLRRIKVEEQLLIEQFGKEYLDYRSHSYYLIPWVY